MNKKNILQSDKEYKNWLKELKIQLRIAQIRAAVKVNTELLKFYWKLGKGIVEKQKDTRWGDGFLKQLSKDLSEEFPDMKGFSYSNIKYIKQWYLFWNKNNAGQQLIENQNDIKSQQVVDQFEEKDNLPIFQIPWGHNLVIISKTKSVEEALFYVQKTIENGWSRRVLVHQIESGLFKRLGKSISNFKKSLPALQSDLAQQTLKDPYNFDFLTIREKHNEKELEEALIKNITEFLLELGEGFSYVGKQYKLTIDNEDFYIDLLFYNIKLHAYVVIELKTGKFKPEYAGKLNFYISAVDELLKSNIDNPTIGLLICKEKKRTIVEYALRDISKPIGVSEYQLTKLLPDEYKSSLPSIEDIEKELANNDEDE